MTALWAILTAFVLVLVWAWFRTFVLLDRGQVDLERIFVVNLDGFSPNAVIHVGPQTHENMKVAAESQKRARANALLVPTALPDEFLGMPVHVSDALKSRTRW